MHINEVVTEDREFHNNGNTWLFDLNEVNRMEFEGSESKLAVGCNRDIKLNDNIQYPNV